MVLQEVATTIGIPPWVLVIALIWSAIWKALGLWKSARKESIIWFIVIFLVNTLGILEILYIFVFSKMKRKKRKK